MDEIDKVKDMMSALSRASFIIDACADHLSNMKDTRPDVYAIYREHMDWVYKDWYKDQEVEG